MMIAEPTTTLTDVVLGIECLCLGRLLWLQGTERRVRSARWLALALLATGIGALLGGASHGLRPRLEGSVWQASLWKATLWSIGATAFFFLGAAAQAAASGSRRRWLLGLAGLELAAYVVWTLGRDEFVWAILDYVPALLLALCLVGILGRWREPAARPLAVGIVLTFAGAAIQASGLSLHPSFNHNDLFHVVQMAAVWFLYRGGTRLRDAA